VKLGELWQRLDLLQKTLRFKVIATIAILLVSGGIFGGILVAKHSALTNDQTETLVVDGDGEQIERVGEDTATIIERQLRAQIAAAQQETPFEAVLAAAFIIGTAIALAAVWLGLAITYLGLALLGIAIAYPVSLIPGLRGLGRLGLGVIPLIFILVTLLELARLLLSGSHPLLAVARNLLNEAVRMKISLVFIVILLVLLAVIPTALSDDQPLRYRIQQWMQYGTGISYLILSLMTIFFCAASVAFEQRDKIIWQTMTKPVPAWAYVLGKWTGVMILNAVLLLVVSGGVFIFTKYLELQPAQGEVAYHRVIDRTAPDGVRDTSVRGEFGEDYRTLDRRLLEDQVLVARVGLEPVPEQVARERINEMVARRVALLRSNDPTIEDTPQLRTDLANELIRQAEAYRRAVDLGGQRTFEFTGLDRFVGTDGDLTLRYQIQAGSNDPSVLYTVGFRVNGLLWPPNPDDRTRDGVRQVGLKVTQVTTIPAALITPDGRILLDVYNFPSNPQTFVFSPDGLELLYPAGGYELNYTRVNAVLLIKFGFIAAVAIALATFVSFPVAVVVTLCVLFATESAGYMNEALESFATTTPEGNPLPLQMVARVVTVAVVWLFGIYTNLTPIESLSDGRLLGWDTLSRAMFIIGIWTAVVLAFGVAMFRRRELAIYSGH